MLLIRHIRQLMTCAGAAPRCGPDQRALDIIQDGTLVADGERIVFAGPDRDLPPSLTSTPDAQLIDGRGLSVVPGFVDAHTHAMFAGDRRDELRRRLAGASYAEIAAGGGGIVSTVQATREASEDALVEGTRSGSPRCCACGTTTAEIKSGYGLDLDTELKMLRAIRRVGANQPVDIATTFMGAHEIPRGVSRPARRVRSPGRSTG